MSVLFFDGFDYGVPAAPKWDSVSLSNTFTADSGRRGTGTGALDLESTADNAIKTVTAATDMIVGVAIKGWGEGVFLELYEGATLHVSLEFGASPNYYIKAKRGDGTTLYTDADANTDGASWAYFECRVAIHNSTGTVTVKKNGTSIIAETSLDTNNAGAVGTINKIKLRGTHAGSTFYDDLYVVSTTDATAPVTYLGSTVRVDTLLPTADETAEWTPSTGTSNYALVDEVPYATTDYVESATLNARDLYLLGTFPYVPSAIYGAQVNIVALEDTASTLEAAPAMKIGVSNFTATGVALTTSAQLIARLWTQNPATTLDWTRADINALAAGVKLTAV